MPAAEYIKALTIAIFHLRDCQIRPTESCKDCVQFSVRIATALAEGVEVAKEMRGVAQKVSRAQIGAATPHLPLGPGTPPHLRP